MSIRLSHALLDPSSDLPWQGVPIALGHFHDPHVRAILDLGDKTTAPKSDARHEWDQSFEQPAHCLHELRAVALHLSDLVDQVGVHGSGSSIQFLLDQRNEAIRLNAIASHRNKRPKPDVSENDTTPAEPNRLEAYPLTMLSKFQRQEACQSTIVKVFHHPLQNGGLTAAGGTGQEQVLEPGE